VVRNLVVPGRIQKADVGTALYVPRRPTSMSGSELGMGNAVSAFDLADPANAGWSAIRCGIPVMAMWLPPQTFISLW
jgi:hypothetical protein